MARLLNTMLWMCGLPNVSPSYMARQFVSMLHVNALSNVQPFNVSAAAQLAASQFKEYSWVYYGQMSSQRIGLAI